MEEILKELIAKFNACKEEGLSYRTYKDSGLEEAFEKAEAFLNKPQPKDDENGKVS